MRRLWMPLILLLAVLLSACGGSTGQAPTEVVQTKTATTAPTATQAAVPTTASTALATQPVAGPGQPMSNCTVESTLPTPSPAEASRFAAVTESDWILGNPDAKITLLEYSDFM